jgi:WD40 repeat protein
LAIANEDGQITVHNIHSSGVLYNLEKLKNEITSIQFFMGSTNFWIAATCWEGKVNFFSQPTISKTNYNVRMISRSNGHSHDVLCQDINEVYVATSGVDNKLVIWNTFTGNLK